MPSCPYEWFNPFEQHARAERAETLIEVSRRDGYAEAMHCIFRNELVAGRFISMLHEAVRAVATALADRTIRPQLQNNRMAYEVYQKRMKLLSDSYMCQAQPMLMGIQDNATLSMRFVTSTDSSPQIELRVESFRPFEYAVRMEL